MSESMPRLRMPRGVWMLGFVSMLMDISSEMVHSLLPMFMVGVLGSSTLAVGLIEGVAEATALIVKVFSGPLSDYLGARKPLAVFGYALGALTKPLFAVASGVGLVLAARFTDRVGKGIRGAPRDALVADLAPAGMRGEAFGLRQSLDTVGAFLGPLLAVALMLLWNDDYRSVFWVAVIPGVLSVLVLILGVPEPEREKTEKRSNPLRWDNLGRLGSAYWCVVATGAVFTLARFSEAFLVLRAQGAGIVVALVPLVMVAMNVVYSASAYPFGKLSDRMSHRKLLAWGIAVLIAADLVLAASPHWGAVLLGVVLWGIHMGMSQGLLATMIAHTAPPDLRHRLWLFQFGKRAGHAGGQRARRLFVGPMGTSLHVWGGSSFWRSRPGGPDGTTRSQCVHHNQERRFPTIKKTQVEPGPLAVVMVGSRALAWPPGRRPQPLVSPSPAPAQEESEWKFGGDARLYQVGHGAAG